MAITVGGKLVFGPSIVKDGLTLYLDAANSTSFIKRSTYLNMASWSGVSSGSTGYYNQNGETVENVRILGTDPWGKSAYVWECRPLGNNADDGGWNTSVSHIDSGQTYRFSVWVKRTSSSTGGTFYLGLTGLNQVGSNVGVKSLYDSHTETNPYWHCDSTSTMIQNQWYLAVAHVFPYFYSGAAYHIDSGLYTITGKTSALNGCNIGLSDCIWRPTTFYTQHRTYLFYCADSTTRVQFYDPRIDLVDGTEPTINMLLTQSPVVAYDLSGNKYNGTMINTEPYASYIATNNSFLFHAINERIQTSLTNTYTVNNRSWNAWVYALSIPSGIYSMFMGEELPYFAIYDDGGGNRYIIYSDYINSAQQGISSTNHSIQSGVWYNFAFTREYTGGNSTLKIYINGAFERVAQYAGASSYYGGIPFCIGDGTNSDWYKLNGYVSNVQVYSRTLSATEIVRNYDALKGRFGLA